MNHSANDGRPVILLDLGTAADDLGELLCAIEHWMPEAEWVPFADELRKHLRAASGVIERAAEKHWDRVEDYGTDIARGMEISLAHLRETLSGRTAAIRR